MVLAFGKRDSRYLFFEYIFYWFIPNSSECTFELDWKAADICDIALKSYWILLSR